VTAWVSQLLKGICGHPLRYFWRKRRSEAPFSQKKGEGARKKKGHPPWVSWKAAGLERVCCRDGGK